MHDVVLLLVGFFVAFIGAMSGGGAGLLSFLALISSGLPINQAIATNKVGDLGFFPPVIRNFTKAKKVQKRTLLPIIAVNLAGVTVGTLAIAYLDTRVLRYIIVIILALVIISTLLKKEYALEEREPKWYWPYAYFGTSVSWGALGAGSGLLSVLVLMYFRGFTALKAMAHSFYANFFGQLLSVALLSLSGIINYRFAFFLFIGNLIGAHFGSKIVIKEGDAFARYMIILLASIVTVRLLFFM